MTGSLYRMLSNYQFLNPASDEAKYIKGKIKQADFSTEHSISDETEHYLQNLEKRKCGPIIAFTLPNYHSSIKIKDKYSLKASLSLLLFCN